MLTLFLVVNALIGVCGSRQFMSVYVGFVLMFL